MKGMTWWQARELAKQGTEVRREAWPYGLWLSWRKNLARLRFFDSPTRVVESKDVVPEHFLARDWTTEGPEGPALLDVDVSYSLTDGVTPQQTLGDDGKVYYIPRVNTWREDGEQLNFFDFPGQYSLEIVALPTNGTYGIDVFARTPQVVDIVSDPVVPVVQTLEQQGTQRKFQMVFTTPATVSINVGLEANARMVAFSVDMSGPVSTGAHLVTEWVEVRGSFNNFIGGELYRLFRDGNVYSGSFPIAGSAGASATYKFYGQGITWESGADRTLILGPQRQAQTVPPAVWNI